MIVHSGSPETLVALLIDDHLSLVGGEGEVTELQHQKVGTGFTFPLLPWRIPS